VEPDEIASRLTPIFREVFEKPSLVVTPGTSARDIENWDSLNHVTLIMQVERAFGIRFALGELQDLKDVGALISLIRKKAG
jgi:acyl carrier protein